MDFIYLPLINVLKFILVTIKKLSSKKYDISKGNIQYTK